MKPRISTKTAALPSASPAVPLPTIAHAIGKFIISTCLTMYLLNNHKPLHTLCQWIILSIDRWTGVAPPQNIRPPSWEVAQLVDCVMKKARTCLILHTATEYKLPDESSSLLIPSYDITWDFGHYHTICIDAILSSSQYISAFYKLIQATGQLSASRTMDVNLLSSFQRIRLLKIHSEKEWCPARR